MIISHVKVKVGKWLSNMKVWFGEIISCKGWRCRMFLCYEGPLISKWFYVVKATGVANAFHGSFWKLQG